MSTRRKFIKCALCSATAACVPEPKFGDGVAQYGRKKNIPSAWKRTLANLDHQLLHAWRLGFQHPDGAVHHHSVDPPADFKTICETVGIDWQCAGELDFNP